MTEEIKYSLTEASKKAVIDELEKICGIENFILESKVLKNPAKVSDCALAIYQKIPNCMPIVIKEGEK